MRQETRDKRQATSYGILILVFFVSSFVLVGSALAHNQGYFWQPGEPIVPCGPNYYNANGVLVTRPACTQCELLHLVRHLIDFVMLAATPILATAFFILAGVYMMLGGAKPDMLATGKRIFTNTMIGLLIVMLAWLIVNTVIRTLMDPTVTNNTPWWQVSCQNVGLSPNPPTSSGGVCTDFGGGYFECVGGINGGLQCDPNNGNGDCP